MELSKKKHTNNLHNIITEKKLINYLNIIMRKKLKLKSLKKYIDPLKSLWKMKDYIKMKRHPY